MAGNAKGGPKHKWRRRSTLDATPPSSQTFRCTRPRTDFSWLHRHRHLHRKTRSQQTLSRRSGGFFRRLETALNTLRKNLDQKSNDEVADDELLLKTLENVVSAKKSYMHHRDRCT